MSNRHPSRPPSPRRRLLHSRQGSVFRQRQLQQPLSRQGAPVSFLSSKTCAKHLANTFVVGSVTPAGMSHSKESSGELFPQQPFQPSQQFSEFVPGQSFLPQQQVSQKYLFVFCSSLISVILGTFGAAANFAKCNQSIQRSFSFIASSSTKHWWPRWLTTGQSICAGNAVSRRAELLSRCHSI